MAEEKRVDANDDLGTERVGKLLMRFSVPCVLSMLVSALYNIVDQIFIGQGVGYLGNAATNVVYPFTVVALALALMIGDGSAALLSLSLGRGDRESAHKSVGNGIVLTGIAAIVVTGIGVILMDPILTLFGVTEGCYEYAREYMSVILLGIPFYMVTSSTNGAIRADGSPHFSMAATAVGALINIVLDPVAIFILDWGVWGAAAATVVGQVVTCILSVLYFFHPKSFVLCKKSFSLCGNIVKRIFMLGISSLAIQVAIVVVISVANHMIGSYGPQSPYGADIPLSVVGIVMKVFAIVIAFAVGIAVGGQPIAGYNYGAGNFQRVKETYWHILRAVAGVGVISTVLFECWPQAIVNLFGNESEQYNQYARLCFRVFLGGILLCCIQKASSIFLQSIGKPVKSTVLSLSRDVIFFVPGLLILAPLSGVTGMLWAAPVADVLSMLLTVGFMRSEYKKLCVEAPCVLPLSPKQEMNPTDHV